ncbi:GNAT family N-acetyltransferase, partial [Acinetobacter baumannii]
LAVTWFIHDMAVSPAGQGQGLAKRLYAKARHGAMQAGLRCSRLVAVQSAARWWQGLGYAPVALAGEAATKLSRYGEGAVVMGREIGE